MDDLYSSSPRSDISITSIESNSSVSSRKNKRKNKKKHSYQDFIREETNLFEVFNKETYYVQPHNYESVSNVVHKNEVQKKYLEFLKDNNIPIVFAARCSCC